ncbi:MAG: protein kinase [Ktedonobacteraceae bacterium]|nr:protein kinase [Ktedonobacteraceae bacterium]
MNSNRRYLGPYQLQKRLEGNGTGEVWQAFDERQQRIVAVTVLHVSSQDSSELIPRFLYETKNLRNLQHPNIAQILDVQISSPSGNTQQPTDVYIVTEYVEGPSLADYLAATSHVGKFPTVANLYQMLAPIASALDYAHQNGIIHGRINPTSIVFDARKATENSPGEPRLINFGTHGMQPTLALPIYDVYYISPEIAQGYTENTRSDLYSLGVILYELCTGTHPFQGDTVADVMMQQIHATPMSPVLINPRVVPTLTAVIMRCLAKEPAARFPTVSAMVAALDRVLKSPASISLGLSNPGFSDPGLYHTPTISPSNTGNPNSNPGYTPLPLVPSPSAQPVSFGSVPAVQQANQQSSSPYSAPQASGPNVSSDSSPTFLTPAHNSLQSHLSAAQTMRTPSPATLPVQNVPYSNGAQPLAARPPVRPRRRLLPLLLTLALVAVLVISGLSIFLFHPFGNGTATTGPIFGHTFFTSSGLINQNDTRGIADGVQIDLQNLPNPQAGKGYYAWLLADTDGIETSPLSLGSLTVLNGHATKKFVDPQNNDLLSQYSRFLVTEENASAPPNNPSLNNADWRYAAFFSRVPNPDDLAHHYSVLDHLRHLLAQDPTLKGVGLDGGLDTWLFRNTLKILEWSGSAHDAFKTHDSELIRRQSVRILDYLDGTQLVTTENLPSDLSPVLVDPTIGKVGMFQISPNQNPPGYLKHIGNHLREISLSGHVTPTQQQTANKMNVALNNVHGWLDTVHSIANQLVHMTPDQLKEPSTLTLLNTMLTQSTAAFVGKTDPNTNEVKEGVSQIHYEAQSLATFDVQGCSSVNVKNFCA